MHPDEQPRVWQQVAGLTRQLPVRVSRHEGPRVTGYWLESYRAPGLPAYLSHTLC